MTFSIVARDPANGRLGVATSTGLPAVGALVPHVKAGIGAVATQSQTNPFLAIDGLSLMEQGETAASALDRLIASDAGRDDRQCIMIAPGGDPVAWTGAAAIPSADQVLGEHFAVAGNMLDNETVVPAMAAAYAATNEDMLLELRLLVALEAGQAAGGDMRGAKSAAVKVCGQNPVPEIDLRIDLSQTPVADLRELIEAARESGYTEFVRSRPFKSLI
ncbi:MAG: DUF1028 domain-containing protein [Hyphomicrobiaceae bacterium]|nr:DUF1028 domain-containing protein [Hyphomicrobiaceae bacterium]MCC0023136.1 DUF1028 domain-containing protein [Hyphomicrobiaceae bacterium]